jgi:hypothetical protein
MLSLKRDSAFLRGAVPALALEFLRFVLCLERWVACLARDRIRVAAVKARRGLDGVPNVLHLRALADERLQVSVELAFARFFELLRQGGEVLILISGGPIDTEARAARKLRMDSIIVRPLPSRKG